MKVRRVALGIGVLVAFALLIWRLNAAPPGAGSTPDNDRVAALLRDRQDNEGYARVLGPRPFQFPQDHAAHPDFRHEWWYVTGQVQTPAGRWFGFQATFFRFALSPVATASDSAWRSQQALLAHFALTDVDGQTFHAHERRARVSHGLANAETTRAAVWVNNWSLHQNPADDVWELRLQAENAALSLALTPTQALVLQGDRGYSQKSAAEGNASHYYSLPRLATRGTLHLNGETLAGTGQSWLDHAWGTSALGEEQQGWDWFAVHLDDGRALTFYRLRQRSGQRDPFSRGLLVAADGSSETLGAEAVEMTPLRWWLSPRTGARYPVQWRVRIPSRQIEFELNAVLDAQEWTGDLRYWEGAVTARATDGLSGRGYLELTGYLP